MTKRRNAVPNAPPPATVDPYAGGRGEDALEKAMRESRDLVAVDMVDLTKGALRRIKAAGGKRPPIADVQLIRDLVGLNHAEDVDEAEVARARRALEALETAGSESVHQTAAKAVRFLNWYAKQHTGQWAKLAPLLGVSSSRARKGKA